MADGNVLERSLNTVRRAMWILQTLPDDTHRLTIRVGAGGMKTVGRTAPADFVLPAALVSRLHCRLEASDESLTVVDLDSTNGTYVNDRRVERAPLRSGDRLRVGRVELTVDRIEPTAPQ